MNETILSFPTKLIATGLAYVIIQAGNMVGYLDGVIEKSLTVGILLIVAYLMYKELRRAQDYNVKRDEKMEKIVEQNLKRHGELTEVLNKLVDKIEDIK